MYTYTYKNSYFNNQYNYNKMYYNNSVLSSVILANKTLKKTIIDTKKCINIISLFSLEIMTNIIYVYKHNMCTLSHQTMEFFLSCHEQSTKHHAVTSIGLRLHAPLQLPNGGLFSHRNQKVHSGLLLARPGP